MQLPWPPAAAVTPGAVAAAEGKRPGCRGCRGARLRSRRAAHPPAEWQRGENLAPPSSLGPEAGKAGCMGHALNKLCPVFWREAMGLLAPPEPPPLAAMLSETWQGSGHTKAGASQTQPAPDAQGDRTG